ncbi:MAG TPA: aminotransferase class III-fold pyridoxal phosphate-dependent enzyme [Candidatus Blautia faecavium]|uniref:Aminotransferase class III-fold pyridoxal phosphate-dependent enzyme n=1 Tax=Candidatus Blautia faecavium TaxID=2838487 RepID=A0A9D2LT70_9FIRM|nr:aminotransferase class III-fold pyridoxal phosphate-dependent enzyme [Candidatus Blautia faecavium]
MGLCYQESLEHFLTVFKKSGEMSEYASEFIPGSYSRRSFNYGPHAIYVDRAEGAYVYTIDGKRLLDFNNNFTVSVLGYQNKQVDQAIIDTMKKGFSIGNPTEEEVELAKMLCERIDSFEKVKFFCSASEACVGALRIARAYTGKRKAAKMEGGYHGFLDDFSFSAHPDASKAGNDLENITPIPESAGIPENRAEDVVLLTQNNIEVCEKLLRKYADELACVVMELQSGSGGIVTLDIDFVKRIRELTKELGILLIFDETIMIRAYKGGFQSRYGIKPDLTISGKTIGGGIPLGVVGGSAEVMDIVAKDIVQMSGTHHGHRLACAAGIATLKQLDDAAYERLNSMGERIKEELNGWAEKRKLPFVLFGESSVLGYAFTKEPGQTIRTHRDYWNKSDGEKMQTYALEIAARGFLPVHRGQLGLTLPMTDEDIANFIETTKEIVTEIYQ